MTAGKHIRHGKTVCLWIFPPDSAILYGMDRLKLLPLGIQDFSILREKDCLYVDKTRLIHQLTHTKRAVFLSRPRRFGKSLLLSTLKYYFLGRRDLFRELAIEELEGKEKDPWAEYPVFYFSLASGAFNKNEGLQDKITNTLAQIEEEYGLPAPKDGTTLPVRLENDLRAAVRKTGKRVVVLIDEYDKPLLETMTVNKEQEEFNRILYKEYWSVLKDCDEFLQFYMFTGVTKFSKVSIFSDLNQLTDISLIPEYNNICGISQSELEASFDPYIRQLAGSSGLSCGDCLAELKRMYDGYHFSGTGEGMYNPFSILHCLDEKKFGYYWFESGTPTFLINKLKASKLDIRHFTDEVKVSESAIKDYRPENPDPTPLFYQSGYLTIKSWNSRQNSYKLGFPNAEVKFGFLESLAPSYLNIADRPSPFSIDLLDDAVEEGDTDGMRDWFTAIFAMLPYPAGNDADAAMAVTEQNFQNVIFMALTMMGKYARTEVHSAKGRADCILETADYVYVFEFKRDASAAEALAQIEEKGYAAPYTADRRRLLKIGVNFSSSERNISEWEVR